MRAALAILAALALLAGCVSDNRPDDTACRAPAIELDAALAATELSGDPLAVCRGQQVTLRLQPEVSGVFHIHGYDDAVPATNVVAGEPIELVFTAARSGQFAIEFHPLDDPRGVGVGVLTVHEP